MTARNRAAAARAQAASFARCPAPAPHSGPSLGSPGRRHGRKRSSPALRGVRSPPDPAPRSRSPLSAGISCGLQHASFLLRAALAPATEHAQCGSPRPAEGAATARFHFSRLWRRLREERLGGAWLSRANPARRGRGRRPRRKGAGRAPRATPAGGGGHAATQQGGRGARVTPRGWGGGCGAARVSPPGGLASVCRSAPKGSLGELFSHASAFL